MRAETSRFSFASAMVRRFAGRNLLDHVDDAAAEFRVGDPGKCAGQRETLGCCKKIVDVSR
jgi:hypothetical protein